MDQRAEYLQQDRSLQELITAYKNTSIPSTTLTPDDRSYLQKAPMSKPVSMKDLSKVIKGLASFASTTKQSGEHKSQATNLAKKTFDNVDLLECDAIQKLVLWTQMVGNHNVRSFALLYS